MALVPEKQEYQVYNGTATTSISFPYTLQNPNSGANRTLLIFMGGANPDTATYDGIPLAGVAVDTNPFCAIYIVEDVVLATDGAAKNITFTFGAGRTDVAVLIAEYSNAKQLGSIPPGACNSLASAATHPVDLTTTVDGVPVVLFYLRVENRTMDAQPSGTVLLTNDAGTVYDGQRIIQATGVTPAGAQTFTFDSSGSSNGRSGAVQLEEAAASSDVTGDAAWALPAPSFAASGEIPIAATSQFVVPSLGFGGAAQVPVAAQAALAIPAVSLAASGDVPVSADAALGLPRVEFSGAAQGDVAGTAGITLPGIAFAAGGDITVRGALSLAMPALTMSMAGTVADFRALIITGRMVMRAAITGETTLRQAVTGAASMRQHITGRTALHPFAMVPGEPPLPGGVAVFGTLVATIPPLAFAGVGELVSPPLEGQAALTIPSIGFGATAGLALPPIDAAAALTLPMLTLAGSGTVEAPPPTPLTDSFDRPDNASSLGNADTGQPWTVILGGVFGIQSNRAAHMGTAAAYATADAGFSDCDGTLTIVTLPTNGAYVLLRFLNASNMLRLQFGTAGSAYILRKFVGGVQTVLGSFGAAADGDVISWHFDGADLDFSLNGVPSLSITDAANQSETRFGFGAATSASLPVFDNLDVQPL